MDTAKLIDAMYRSRQEPEYWFMTADMLQRGADLLFQQVEARHPDGEPIDIEDVQLQIEKPAMLLLGLAFENTVKGSLLFHGIVTWEQASKRTGPWTKHNLTELYKQTKSTLTKEERWLLDQLSAFTVWAGKYPLCFKPENFALDADHSRERPPKLPPTGFSSTQRCMIVEMMKKLRNACKNE
jgi:hypothetical protein